MKQGQASQSKSPSTRQSFPLNVGYNQYNGASSGNGPSQKYSARDISPVPSLEQALADRLQAFSDLQNVQKEMRQKEQDYIKKLALQEQKIELLEI